MTTQPISTRAWGRWRPIALVALLLTWVAAPARTQSTARSATVHDIASIPVLGWTVGRPIPVEADPPEFYHVIGMAGTRDGGFVVGDQDAGLIRSFASDGRQLGQWSRSGDGPGEFRALSSLGLHTGDTLWAYDVSGYRLSYFEATGRFARRTHLASVEGFAIAEVLGVRDRRVVTAGSAFTHGERPSGLWRDSVLVAVVDEGDRSARVIARVPGSDQVVQLIRQPRGIAYAKRQLPLGFETAMALSGDHLLTAGTERYAIDAWGLDGTRRSRVEVRVPRIPTRGQALRAWARAQGPDDSPDRIAAREAAALALPLHDYAPEIAGIVADRGSPGGFWVRRFTMPGALSTEWVVHDASARPIGRLLLPAEWELRAIDADRLLMIVRNEDGEPAPTAVSLRR